MAVKGLRGTFEGILSRQTWSHIAVVEAAGEQDHGIVTVPISITLAVHLAYLYKLIISQTQSDIDENQNIWHKNLSVYDISAMTLFANA